MINELDKMMMFILVMSKYLETEIEQDLPGDGPSLCFFTGNFHQLIRQDRFFVNKEENRQQGLISMLGSRDFLLPKSDHH